MSTFRCKKNCCTRTFLPLTVAHARTIHKFQGVSAGPVDSGKIPNNHEVIICDPDEKKFELKAIGLLYTATSRATTLGDESGLNSAIYFEGSHFKFSRISNLTKTQTGEECEMAKKRKRWVGHLMANNIRTLEETLHVRNNKQELFQWMARTTINVGELMLRINEYRAI